MLGVFLGMAAVGWFVSIVAAVYLFSVAAWLVAVILLLIMLIFYVKFLGEAVSTRNWAWAVDLVLAPTLGTFIGYLLAYWLPMNLDKNAEMPFPYVILLIALGVNAFIAGPFIIIPMTLRERKRRGFRLWAYVSFAAATYIYTTVFVIAGLKF